MGERGIFLDRDGTLIVDKDYLHKPEEVEFIPGSIESLAEVAANGFRLIMVTNQSGVGRGYFTMDDVARVHAHIQFECAKRGVRFDAIYVAPEHPDLPSRGRKPSPQFLFDARDQLGIDLGESFIIGDKLIDLQCGWNAGVKRSILVRTGYGHEVEQKAGQALGSAVVCDDLPAAIRWILRKRD
jgi:D-glycero-D-manno-heptose 1,7-bisphosphate phosphatase